MATRSFAPILILLIIDTHDNRASRLAFADALDLRGVEGIKLPAALALLLRAELRVPYPGLLRQADRRTDRRSRRGLEVAQPVGDLRQSHSRSHPGDGCASSRCAGDDAIEPAGRSVSDAPDPLAH